jgi:WD40 repeat protein
MPLLQGEALDERLKRESVLPIPEVLRIGREMAEGLAAAHERGLIHRDIKPANVWLEGKKGRVKILDFGLARAAGAESNLTQSGAILGTPAYMSPEQGSGQALDARCDLFSLGCVLYRLCTGQPPFRGADAVSTLMAVALTEPTPARDANVQVPPALSDLIGRLLSKDRAQRPATAGAVAEALAAIERDLAPGGQRAVGERTVAMEPPALAASPLPRGQQGSRGFRRGWWVAAGLLLLVGGVAAAVVVIIRDRNNKEVGRVVVPEGGKAEVVEEGKGPGVPQGKGDSPLDRLDPKLIPAEERFDWQPKELVAVIGEHRGRHWGRIDRQLLCSPDGKLVASLGDSKVCLFDAATLRPRAVIDQRHGGIVAVAFSPDGKTLACGVWEGQVRFYDLGDGEPRHRAALRPKTVRRLNCLAFSPDGKTLACGHWEDGAIALWDLAGEKPRERALLQGHKSTVGQVIFSPDGKVLASGSLDGTLRLWDMTAEPPAERAVLEGRTRFIAFSPDGKTLASCAGADASTRLWDLTGAKPRQRAEIKGPAVFLAYAPDGKTLAVASNGDWEGSIKDLVFLFDPTGTEPKVRTALKPFHAGPLAYSPDGKTIFVGQGRLVRAWDVTGEEPRERLEPRWHRCENFWLASSPDNRTLATPGLAQEAVLWDLGGTSPRQRAVLRVHGREDPISYPAFAPDNKTLALCAGSGHVGPGSVQLFDLTTPEPEEGTRFKVPGGAEYPFFFPDGKTLAVFSESYPSGKAGQLWDLSGEPKERAILPNTVPADVTAGKRLVSYAWDKGLPQVWDVGGAKPQKLALLEQNPPYSPAQRFPSMRLFPDRKTLAVVGCRNGSNVGGLILWDLAGEKPEPRAFHPLGSLINDNGSNIAGLAVTPDGKTVAAVVWSGVWKIVWWDVEKAARLRGWTLPDGNWDNEMSPRLAKQATLASWQMPGQVHGLAFSADGRHLITANDNGTDYILRLERPAEKAAP